MKVERLIYICFCFNSQTIYLKLTNSANSCSSSASTVFGAWFKILSNTMLMHYYNHFVFNILASWLCLWVSSYLLNCFVISLVLLFSGKLSSWVGLFIFSLLYAFCLSNSSYIMILAGLWYWFWWSWTSYQHIWVPAW